MNSHKMRLTGSGGQGLILAGIILAEAALKEGKNAIQTQSYGPEARGGASRAEVIISDDDIVFPKIEVPNILLCLTQVACDKFVNDLEKDGILIVDESVELPDSVNYKKIIKAPIISTASNEVGRAIVANIVAMGLLNQITNVVDKNCLSECILARVPKGTEELNMKALEAGYTLGEKIN